MKTKQQILTQSGADIFLIESCMGMPKTVTNGILKAMDVYANQVAQSVSEELE